MNSPKHRKCKRPECSNTFLQYNSLKTYCSPQCRMAHGKPKLVNKISAKRQKEMKEYSRLRTEFLSRPENKICPITGQQTTDIHHSKGRIGTLFLNTDYWIALSREGHIYVEENPEWAYENGYSLKRLN